MAEGITSDLILAAAFAFGFGILALVRRLPLPLALSVVAVKTAIPFIYFAYSFDGVWTFLDDWSYFRVGRSLIARGYDPTNILFSQDGIITLGSAAGSQHFLYYWWNMLSFHLFGIHYYSSIFLNVSLTYIAGIYLVRIAACMGMSKRYCQWLLIFFLLNWDLMAWSSAVNMKDICVMTLTSFSLYHFAQFGVFERKDRRRFISLGLALVAFLVLGSLRFYVPVLMIVSYGLWLWIHRTGFARLTVTGVLLLFTVLVLSKYGAIARDNQLTTSPFGIAAGLFRFMLTPRPWDIEERYQFLTIAVLFHWLFLLPVFQSARKFWQISYQHRFIVVYVVVACLFYSVVKELQGPRGRVQFIFLWAWLEFHFVYTIWIRWQGHQTFLHHELPPGKQITT